MSDEATTEQTDSGLSAGEKFALTEETTEDGRWYATVEWTPRDQPTGITVVLRELKRGKIQIDYGSRGAGGRKSTETDDPQEAIWFAEERLKELVLFETREDLDGDDLHATLHDAGGDPTLVACFNWWLKKNKTGGNGVTPKWWHYIERVRDIWLFLLGPSFRALDLNQERVDEYTERRTSETIDFGGERETLEPDILPETAGAEIHATSTVLNFAAKSARPMNSRERVLKHNPLDGKDIHLPDKSKGTGKRPLTLHHYEVLMTPIEIGGELRPAPIDRVDNDPLGRARIINHLMFHHARRSGNYVVGRDDRDAKPGVLRKHLAITREEVKAALTEMERAKVPGVSVEMADQFPHGIFVYIPENDKEGCRRDQDRRDWWRIYPLTEIDRAEFNLYHRRTLEATGRGCYDWHPEDPLFPDTMDPSQPLRRNPMFRSPKYKVAKGGEETFNQRGRPVVARAGDRLFDAEGRRVVYSQGGWFRQAQNIARADAKDLGLDPDEVMPLYKGELAHGTRAGWIQRVEEKGWLRVEDDQRETDLNRHVLYLEDRKLPDSSRVRNYMRLDPVVLMGIAEYRHPADVLGERERNSVEDDQEKLDRVSRGRELYFHDGPDLKVHDGGAA